MRFKSVLGAFLFILLASSIAMVIFVQTRSFGNLVTRVVTDLSQKKLGTKVKMQNISFNLFPPGLELNRVSVEKEISPQERFSAEFGVIAFYLNLIEVEEKKLSFGEIKISDAVINSTFPESNEELKEIDQKLINRIFEIPNELPIRIDTLLIENALIHANHDLLEVRRLKIFRENESFISRFHLSNINPKLESGHTLDEVWGDIKITKKNIQIFRLKAQHDTHAVLLKGSIRNYPKLKNARASLNGELNLHLLGLSEQINLPKEIDVKSGLAKASFKLDYKDSKINSIFDVFVENFRSSVLYADELRSVLKLDDTKLSIETLNLQYKNQKANLLKSVEVFNIKTGKYLEHPIEASVTNFSLNNALRILGPSLEPLKGNLTGKFTFQYDNQNLFFLPAPNFKVNKLGLVVGDKKDPFTVLMVDNGILNNSRFTVIDGEFKMAAAIKLPNSNFTVEGFVNKNKVQFNVPTGKIDFEDFGNISNLDIKGKGDLSIKVAGPLDNTVITISGLTDGFEILGYKLGKTDKIISIDLGNSSVNINKMESTFGRTSLTGHGTVNYSEADIALGITTTNANSSDLFHILKPVLDGVDFLPDDLDFKAKVDVDIFGKYRFPELKIRSRVNFNDLTAFGENLNSGSFEISLLNQNLAFKNFMADKGKGNIHGDFSIGLKNKEMKLDYQWDNIELSTINASKALKLNLQSNLSGKVSGGGKLPDFDIQLFATAFETKTQNYTFSDSSLSLQASKDRIKGKANLLGDIVNLDFNLSLNKSSSSEIQWDVKATDLKPFLVAIFGEHMETEHFTGRVAFNGNTGFQQGLKDLSLTANLRELNFNHAGFNVNYNSNTPQFIVKNGVIEHWKLSIKQPDLFLEADGEGTFGKNVSIVHEAHFNSKLVEILFEPILSAEGTLVNIIRLDGKGDNFDLSVSSKANSLDISIDKLPVLINDLKYAIEFADRRLEIKELRTTLDSGTISLRGDVFFDNEQPDVNIKFMLDKAEIPILGKSSINASGEGIILGNNYPYNVGGEIIINRAVIVNELNEFSSKSAGFSEVRFLPKNQESPLAKMFTLNINVKAENPIRMTNSLMDVAVAGEVRVFGNPSRPRGEGRLSSPHNSSRIFFKNNEYQIVTADINFNPKKEISNPDFDIQAVTTISSYKVFPKAYGDLERFNFDLTSEPALPRNSILSLIAFGYTDEIQSSLYAKDQQSLTEVGVGSFVFDRFKISDILNKQFGLQVNLGTVIEQSSTDSLLSGRSQDGGGGNNLGRTRSATKIELKKRLDEALTLSVSSTMGGSIGQRQSMNLNYGISKNIQLEGVYELRTNEEGEADIIYNSIGGDIKFRKTFR